MKENLTIKYEEKLKEKLIEKLKSKVSFLLDNNSNNN